MASSVSRGDKYRSYLNEGESITNYLEEKVQNLVKTWEMEMFHKLCPDDYKTADPKKLTLSLNGKPRAWQMWANLEGFFLQTALPKNLRFHNPKDETLNSALVAFTTTFPRGFAIEVLQVYSGPPVIACKFRRWGYMEGPFKGHAPMGEMVQFFGIRILELDENAKIVKVEFFFNHGELLGGLMQGVTLQSSDEEASATSCPFIRNTG
ncbi:hypothetical protein ACJRO7_024623 [Eucalyptus globulus]|uniref:Pathogen-related protein n=1 Tax=Eucalyptus globulus TaxID=34317 RepID=A0ABD3K648_EUCGL